MTKLLALGLLLSTSAFAETGSLWCAFSSYGTPTETAEKAALPYSLVQVDKMTAGTIQLTIDDLYNETTEVSNVNLLKNSGKTISGIAIGTYSKNVEVKVVNGKILLTQGIAKYNCEIPGDYKLDYSSDVK